MDRERRLQLLIGSFVLGCSVLFAVAVLTLSSERGAWVPTYRLVAHFDMVQGLMGGAPVLLSGKNVGVVKDVRFSEMGSDRPAVEVILQIDRAVQDRIRTDSIAGIDTLGLLGDKYIEISMGSSLGVPLEDGSELPSRDPYNYHAMIDQGALAVASVTDLASSLSTVVRDFEKSMGGSKAAESVASIRSILHEIQTGDGLLHQLVYLPYAGSAVQDAETSMADIAAILREIREGDGLVNGLVYGPYAESGLPQLSASAASIDDILREVREGDGFLHGMVYGAPGDQTALASVQEASGRLSSILTKIDEGEGTLGLLLNDPTLYEDLKRLMGGAERSVLLRSLIRKAAESEEKAAQSGE